MVIISLTITKLLSLLAYPLSLSLLLAAMALALRLLGWRRSALALASIAGLGLYLCSTAPVANFLMDALERDYPPRAMSDIEPADAILLLGGAMRGDPVGRVPGDTLGDLNQQADRLVYAAALYRAHKAPVLVLTGGGDSSLRPEAVMMRDILRVMGVPDSAMILESMSRDTHDNALYSARLLHRRGVQRVLLVTSAFHMRRAVALFHAQGLDVDPAPTDYQQLLSGTEALSGWLPDAANLMRTTHAIHELLGYEVYRWRGWLSR